MKRNVLKIIKPADALPPAALLIAALLGRSAISLGLFISCYAVKLCAMATSDGLRRAFAVQPSMRSVQGSSLFALVLQPAGALICVLISALTHQSPLYYAFIVCGLLYNIERVFYEYLYALGEDRSAMIYRSVTAAMTLTGLLLCVPPSDRQALPASPEIVWPLAASFVNVSVGLTLSLALGGKPKPNMNIEVLKGSWLSMLQAVLYPLSAFGALHLAMPSVSVSIPLFSGLILYELCRSPFRRTPTESRTMNRVLLIVCAVALTIAASCRCLIRSHAAPMLTATCMTVFLAALCAFAVYGNIRLGRRDET